jgi:hypothetical protein
VEASNSCFRTSSIPPLLLTFMLVFSYFYSPFSPFLCFSFFIAFLPFLFGFLLSFLFSHFSSLFCLCFSALWVSSLAYPNLLGIKGLVVVVVVVQWSVVLPQTVQISIYELINSKCYASIEVMFCLTSYIDASRGTRCNEIYHPPIHHKCFSIQ